MLTPDAIQILAVATMCAGLVAAGALAGWTLRGRVRQGIEASAVPPLARIEVQLLGHTLRTDAIVDQAQLESLANGLGMTITPMPSRRLQ